VRVRDLRREGTADGARVVARIEWEDADRAPQDLFVAAPTPFDADLSPTTSFPLAAAAVPALRAGERRIAVEGAACPRLIDGLTTVLRMLARWDEALGPAPAIEAREGLRAARPAERRRAGMYLSGGVDSLDLLLENRTTFPSDHPLSVRTALFVHGLDIGAPRQAPRTGFHARVRAMLEPVCATRGVTLVPLSTNVRTLDTDGKAWAASLFGPATVSLAHALAPPLTDVLFAAGVNVEGLSPAGSHPMTDPYLSSGALTVHHEGVHRTRLEKLRRVTDRADTRAVLRVCWQDLPEDGPVNCGRCRKCVRTMLGLLALGRLDDAATFPRHEVVVDDLEVCGVDAHTQAFYEELLLPLERRGRGDLATALRERLARYRAGAGRRGAGPWRRLRRFLRRG
jgi:hypothetical protein